MDDVFGVIVIIMIFAAGAVKDYLPRSLRLFLAKNMWWISAIAFVWYSEENFKLSTTGEMNLADLLMAGLGAIAGFLAAPSLLKDSDKLPRVKDNSSQPTKVAIPHQTAASSTKHFDVSRISIQLSQAPSSGDASVRCGLCNRLTEVPIGGTRACNYCGIGAPLLTNEAIQPVATKISSGSAPASKGWQWTPNGLKNMSTGAMIPENHYLRTGGTRPGFKVIKPEYGITWIPGNEVDEG